MFMRIVFEVRPRPGTWLKFETWAGPFAWREIDEITRQLVIAGSRRERIERGSLKVKHYYGAPSYVTLLKEKTAEGMIAEIFSEEAPLTLIDGLSDKLSTFVTAVDL
jgi:hypothetical protein